ncbi:hypothetical protein J437_LFUL012806 [Ladona fulva]|uniref:Uncharacterized protein n=1 Tax=Ladona fulva TaxID=123851 RepID=A0A8K0KMT9_LADFU|nr:hypothetical protein J437_LFUL012806 [Ladona fulva]
MCYDLDTGFNKCEILEYLIAVVLLSLAVYAARKFYYEYTSGLQRFSYYGKKGEWNSMLLKIFVMYSNQYARNKRFECILMKPLKAKIIVE